MMFLQSAALETWVPIVTGSGGALVILSVVAWKLWKRLERKDEALETAHATQMQMLMALNKEGDALFQKQIETTVNLRRAMAQLNLSLEAVTKVLEAQNVTVEEIRKSVQSLHISLGVVQGYLQGGSGGSSTNLRP